MTSRLGHVALNVEHMEEALAFFQTILAMEVEKVAGEAPNRKIWLKQGIQLNESASQPAAAGAVDHIAILSDNVPAVIEAARQRNFPFLPGKEHWFRLPWGVVIELLPDQSHT